MLVGFPLLADAASAFHAAQNRQYECSFFLRHRAQPQNMNMMQLECIASLGWDVSSPGSHQKLPYIIDLLPVCKRLNVYCLPVYSYDCINAGLSAPSREREVLVLDKVKSFLPCTGAAQRCLHASVWAVAMTTDISAVL